MFETKKDYNKTEKRTLIELLYSSITIKEQALSSKIFLWIQSFQPSEATDTTKDPMSYMYIIQYGNLPIYDMTDSMKKWSDQILNVTMMTSTAVISFDWTVLIN